MPATEARVVLIILPVDSELLHFRLQGRAFQPQAGGGSSRARDDTSGLAQDA